MMAAEWSDDDDDGEPLEVALLSQIIDSPAKPQQLPPAEAASEAGAIAAASDGKECRSSKEVQPQDVVPECGVADDAMEQQPAVRGEAGKEDCGSEHAQVQHGDAGSSPGFMAESSAAESGQLQLEYEPTQAPTAASEAGAIAAASDGKECRGSKEVQPQDVGGEISSTEDEEENEGELLSTFRDESPAIAARMPECGVADDAMEQQPAVRGEAGKEDCGSEHAQV
eukprot:SAG31_NODE_6008_length_2216_cov_18.261691_1_plen_225_part_10